jgi:hypothetical protein
MIYQFESYFTLSMVELFLFLYEVVHLKNGHCIEVDANGPAPLCSSLIYNPYRRYEVSIYI